VEQEHDRERSREHLCAAQDKAPEGPPAIVRSGGHLRVRGRERRACWTRGILSRSPTQAVPEPVQDAQAISVGERSERCGDSPARDVAVRLPLGPHDLHRRILARIGVGHRDCVHALNRLSFRVPIAATTSGCTCLPAACGRDRLGLRRVGALRLTVGGAHAAWPRRRRATSASAFATMWLVLPESKARAQEASRSISRRTRAWFSFGWSLNGSS
jgi:hypothetical protein